MRLIDADAVLEFMRNRLDMQELYLPIHFKEFVTDEMPTAERAGKWIRHPEVKNIYGGVYIECSECREKYVVQYVEDEKFCRNCGARMEGEEG